MLPMKLNRCSLLLLGIFAVLTYNGEAKKDSSERFPVQFESSRTATTSRKELSPRTPVPLRSKVPNRPGSSFKKRISDANRSDVWEENPKSASTSEKDSSRKSEEIEEISYDSSRIDGDYPTTKPAEDEIQKQSDLKKARRKSPVFRKYGRDKSKTDQESKKSNLEKRPHATHSKRVKPSSDQKNLAAANPSPKSAAAGNVNISNGKPLSTENNNTQKRRKVLRVRNRNNNTTETMEAKIISNKQVEVKTQTPSVIEIENTPISRGNQQENDTTVREKDQISSTQTSIKDSLNDSFEISEIPSIQKEFETIFDPSLQNQTSNDDQEKPGTAFRHTEKDNQKKFPNQNFNLELKPAIIPESDGQYMLSYNYVGKKNDQPKDVIKLSEYSKKGIVKKAQEVPEKKSQPKKRKIDYQGTKNFESQRRNKPQAERAEFAKRFTPILNSEDKFTDPTNTGAVESFDVSRSPVTYKKKSAKKSNDAVWSPAKLAANEDTPISKKTHLKTENQGDGFYHSFNNRSPYPGTKSLDIENGSSAITKNYGRNINSPAKKQSSEKKGKYFMHMFKRVGDLSSEFFDSSSGEIPRNDGFLSSLKLSWNDDDRRAQVDTSIDSRMQPSTFNLGSSIFQSSLEDNLKASVQRAESSVSVPVGLSISEASSSKEVDQRSPSRTKRSPSKDAEHFFESHFTMGEKGSAKLESKSSPSLYEKQYNAPGTSRDSQKGAPLDASNHPIGIKPQERSNNRWSNLEDKPYYLKPDIKNFKEIYSRKPDLRTEKRFTQPEVRSYYLKPEDVQEIKRLTESFHSQQLHFPFEDSRKPVKPFRSHRVPNNRPGLGVYYSEAEERQNVQTLPRHKIAPTSSIHNGKEDFHSSYKTPSETQIIPSTIKLTKNLSEDTIRMEMRNESSPLNTNGTAMNPQVQAVPKLHRRTGPLSVQKTTENATRSNDLRKGHELDEERQAASQHVHRLSKETSRSIGPHAWEYGFEQPRVDAPRFNSIPKTSFDCRGKHGYHADPETGCQVFHMCQGRGAKHSFLCPNNTIFNQQLLVCDWHDKVNCDEGAFRSGADDQNEAGRQWKWAAQQANTYGSFKRRKADAQSDGRNNVRPKNYVSYRLQGSDPKTTVSLPNHLPNSPRDTRNTIQQGGSVNDHYQNKFQTEKTVKDFLDNKTVPQELHDYKENEYSVLHGGTKPENYQHEGAPIIYQHHEKGNNENLNPQKIQELSAEPKQKPFSINQSTNVQPSIAFNTQDRTYLYHMNPKGGAPKETHFDIKPETAKSPKWENDVVTQIPPRYYQETTSTPLRNYATTFLEREPPKLTTNYYPISLKENTPPSLSIPVQNNDGGHIIEKNTFQKHINILSSDLAADIQKVPLYKPAVSLPDDHKSNPDPKMSVYTYPLQPETFQNNYGKRIAKANSQNLQKETPRKPQKYIDVKRKNSPNINVTSRIAEVISRLQTIGTGVSQILDGKDNLYKNINIHKLKPSAQSQKDFDPFPVVKFPTKIDDTKSARTNMPMPSAYPDTYLSTTTKKHTPAVAKNIDFGIGKKLSNTNEATTSAFNLILNKNDSMSNSGHYQRTPLRNEFHRVIKMPASKMAQQSYKQNGGVNLHVQGRVPVDINSPTKHDRKSFRDSNLQLTGVYTNVRPHGYVVKIHPLRSKGTVKEVKYIQNNKPEKSNGPFEINGNQPQEKNNFATTTEIPQYAKKQMFSSQNSPANSDPGISTRNVNQAEMSSAFQNNNLKSFNHQKILYPRNPVEKNVSIRNHQETRDRHPYSNIPQKAATPIPNSVPETAAHPTIPSFLKSNRDNFQGNEGRSKYSGNAGPITLNLNGDQHKTFTSTVHNLPSFTNTYDQNGNNFRVTEIVRHTTPFPFVNGNSFHNGRIPRNNEPVIPQSIRNPHTANEAAYRLPPPRRLNENGFNHKYYNNLPLQGATPSPNAPQHTVTAPLQRLKPTQPIKNSINKKYFQGILGRQTYSSLPQRGASTHVPKMMPHSKPTFQQNGLPAFIFTVNPSQENLNWKTGQKYNPPSQNRHPTEQDPDCDDSSDESPVHLALGKYGPSYETIRKSPIARPTGAPMRVTASNDDEESRETGPHSCNNKSKQQPANEKRNPVHVSTIPVDHNILFSKSQSYPKGTQQRKYKPKTRDSVKEKERVPIKPMKFYHSQFLTPVVTKKYEAKKPLPVKKHSIESLELPNKPRNVRSSEEASKDSREDSGSVEGDRKAKYRELEKAAEVEAEKMVKSTTQSNT